MDLDIKAQVALVTGSTAGIGFAIAESLVKEGVTVYVNGRTEDRVLKAIDQIKKKHPKAQLLPAVYDLSSQEQSLACVEAIPKIDLLINNLGHYEAKDFIHITDEDWLKIFEVNVLSGVRLCRAYLPQMLKNDWGRILFISSESGIQIPLEMIHYGVTKTAQIALARGLAEMTTGTAVTVNSILAGPTRSEGVETFIEQLAESQNKDIQTIEKEFFKNVRPSSLIKRFATVDEVADLVTFVCSPRAAAINGSALRVEGGVIRSI